MVNFYTRLVATLTGLSSIAQSAAAVTFSSTGQTVVVDGTSYYIPPNAVGTIKSSDFAPLGGACAKSGGFLPMTVIKTGSLSYGAKELSLDITTFSTTDDVYAPGFAEGMYRLPPPEIYLY